MKRPPERSGDDRARLLYKLTAEWLERNERGEGADPADICGDRPELLDDLRRRIEALGKLDVWLGGDGATSEPVSGGDPEPSLSLVGRFRIVQELGRGGMGIVYEAREEPLGRRVALKVLRRSALEQPAHRMRFRIEAQALAGLDHAHIVKVHEFGHADGVDYIAMPFIDGRRLDRWLLEMPDRPQEGPSIQAIARIGSEIAEALHCAHGSGVLHRDVKPSNILIDEKGHGWLVDFGLAQIDGESGPTGSGPLLGSVAYIAPERFEGLTDQRGDIYSLGVTLYEALTANRPFEGESEAETAHRILEGKALPPRRLNTQIPRDLDMIIRKAMARDLADRYASAGFMADDLRKFLAGRPVSARPVPLVDRFLRWHRRSPVVASLAWALFLSLSLGLVGMTALYREAVRQRQNATEDERWAREVLADLSEMVAQDSYLSHPSTTDDRAVLLRKVEDYYDRVIARGHADPAARSYWALSCRRVAEIETVLGHLDRSASHLRRSIEAYESLVRDFPAVPAYRFGLFHALRSYPVGDYSQPMAREGFGFEAQRNAFQTIRSLVDLEPANLDYRDCLAAQGLQWGRVVALRGNAAEAERNIRSAMTMADALSKEAPDRPGFRKNVAAGWFELGLLFTHLGRTEEAAHAFHESARSYSEIAARMPGERGLLEQQACSLLYEGDSLIRHGRTERGVSRLRDARSLVESLLRDQPGFVPYVELRRRIVGSLESREAGRDPRH